MGLVGFRISLACHLTGDIIVRSMTYDVCATEIDQETAGERRRHNHANRSPTVCTSARTQLDVFHQRGVLLRCLL